MRALALVALGGCFVIQPPQERSRWKTTSDTAWVTRCGEARAFVRKTGFDGIGVAIQWKSTHDCTIELTGARVVFADRSVAIAGQPPLVLHARSLSYTWLPVRFDNDEAWNDDRNDAHLELTFASLGQWSIPMHQAAR